MEKEGCLCGQSQECGGQRATANHSQGAGPALIREVAACARLDFLTALDQWLLMWSAFHLFELEHLPTMAQQFYHVMLGIRKMGKIHLFSSQVFVNYTQECSSKKYIHIWTWFRWPAPRLQAQAEKRWDWRALGCVKRAILCVWEEYK